MLISLLIRISSDFFVMFVRFHGYDAFLKNVNLLFIPHTLLWLPTAADFGDFCETGSCVLPDVSIATEDHEYEVERIKLAGTFLFPLC